MTIVKSTENNYCIILSPTELKLFEETWPTYREYMVKDIASFIKFVLQTEVNAIQRSKARSQNNGHSGS